MIGKTISHYKILDELGRGGMGVVFKGEDTKLDRFVALKFLPVQLGQNKEERERFIHEAKAASALQHNNICTIHEIDETDDKQMFICMDYYEGNTLDQIIKKGPLPLSESVNIAIQIASGLEKAHQKEIVHRDIKPSNILLTVDHEVKILDFGLAKLRGLNKLTKEQTTLGTVSYMSPEQSQGREIDHRSDIWSLGVVLYEMITGQRPFPGDYDQAVIYSIINERSVPVTGLRTGVPVELERIVDKCLQKEPGERYQTAGDLIADLHRLQREITASSISSQPADVSRSKRNFIRLWPWAALLVLIVILGILILPRFFQFSDKSTVHERKMLVVLPFKNLGAPEDEYFSDGITDAITARLARISDLGIISRQSAIQYKNSDKNSQEIGEELGVSYILEGTIQRERPTDPTSRVRIIPQLIDAKKDIHLWADTYDETMEAIFSVQTAIAESVATALDIVLLETEHRALQEIPTDNLEAYNYYLQGMEYLKRSSAKNDMEIAIALFDKAVRADPAYAEAYARLAKMNLRMRWFAYDTSPECLARAKEAIDKALTLKPEEPVVREANGYYYYYGFRDYKRALDEFTFCLQKEPENAFYIENIAYIQRRLGRFEEALEKMKKAFHYNPRSNYLAGELGDTYKYLRQYEQSEACYDRAISLAPDIEESYTEKAWIRIYRTGHTEGARQVLERASKHIETDQLWMFADIDIYDGKYEDALHRLSLIKEEIREGQLSYTPKERILGFIFELMGKLDQALIHYQTARAFLEKKVAEFPDDPRLHAELGRVLAHLGLKDRAIEEGKRAVDLMPVSQDALFGPFYLEYLAEIYTIIGEHEASIDELEYLLEIPAGSHVGELKANPVWDPLRPHPRFQKLLERGK